MGKLEVILIEIELEDWKMANEEEITKELEKHEYSCSEYVDEAGETFYDFTFDSRYYAPFDGEYWNPCESSVCDVIDELCSSYPDNWLIDIEPANNTTIKIGVPKKYFSGLNPANVFSYGYNTVQLVKIFRSEVQEIINDHFYMYNTLQERDQLVDSLQTCEYILQALSNIEDDGTFRRASCRAWASGSNATPIILEAYKLQLKNYDTLEDFLDRATYSWGTDTGSSVQEWLNKTHPDNVVDDGYLINQLKQKEASEFLKLVKAFFEKLED